MKKNNKKMNKKMLFIIGVALIAILISFVIYFWPKDIPSGDCCTCKDCPMCDVCCPCEDPYLSK